MSANSIEISFSNQSVAKFLTTEQIKNEREKEVNILLQMMRDPIREEQKKQNIV